MLFAENGVSDAPCQGGLEGVLYGTVLRKNRAPAKVGSVLVMDSELITWPSWYDGDPDDGPIVNRYHVRGFPAVFVLDAKGTIR
jgi:hypothetical protein